MTDPFDQEAERRFREAVLSGRQEARIVFEQRIRCVPRMLAALNARRGRPFPDHDLADLAQDTIVIALRKLPSFQPIAPLEAWLYRLCQYEFLNALRRKRRRREDPAGDQVETVATQATPERSRFDRLHLALERLGGIEADIIRLKHFDELTFAAIAERLAEPENTIKTRYYRGRRRLEELLGAKTEEDDEEGSA